MSITLVATDWPGKIPGFDAEQARDCAFMHDPTVRAWIAGQHAKGTPDKPVRVLLADDEWVNRDGAVESLTFPVDPRDMQAVEALRRAPGGPGGDRGASFSNGPGGPKWPEGVPRPVTHWDFTEGRPAE